MKHIVKGRAPRSLKEWVAGQRLENGERINCSYRDMPRDVHRDIHQHLLNEQGWLCCYTGMNVDESISHIEHLKPQSECQDDEDVDYTNLLAAYPGDRMPCEFGAKAKDNWYDERLLISPLDRRCETKFRFDQFGHIEEADINDRQAKETIRRLRLDHMSLNEMRASAIKEALFPDSKQLGRAKLNDAAQHYCQRNSEHRFRPYCFVVAQVAQDLLRRTARDKKRRQAIRNRSRR
jgi:uncharacterized protein (TIGR02646 family)